MANNICKIYKYTSPSGKVYIGQTWQSLSRRAQKGNGYKESFYFANAIKKYGWNNMKSEIVCLAIDQKDADFWEQHFITKYDSTNPEKGYNIHKGGKARVTLTDAHREKLSIAAKKRPFKQTTIDAMQFANKNRVYNSGYTLSTEHKEKIGIKSRRPRNKRTEEQKQRMSIAATKRWRKYHEQ